MQDIQYESLHKSNYLDKLLGSVFKNPWVYFSILVSVTLLVLILSPHTVILKDPSMDDKFEDRPRYILSDFHVDLPDALALQGNLINLAKLNQSSSREEIHPQKANLFIKVSPSQILGRINSSNSQNLDQCSGFLDNERFDCFPQENVSEESCNLRGCCWAPINTSARRELGVPFCYYPSKFRSYKYVNVSVSDEGATAFLAIAINSTYPDNVQLLKIDFNFLSQSVLQVKIYDANHARFESPFPKLSLSGRCSSNSTAYIVDIDKDKLGFNVIRKSDNCSVFNAEDIGGFIFADQMLQLSARLPSRRLYGLGQQRNEFQLNMNWQRVTLFNHDREPVDKTNLYGSHPFYLAVEDGGISSGVFLHNTNAMDIILQPTPAITYRTIGGVLDFFFFLGPSPAEVIQQYTELVGRPALPPYWSLGFHLCRFGYNSLENTITVWNRTRAAGIPFDVQWNDIDYMDHRNDFTYDKSAFKGLPEFVDTLHKQEMHYVVILDPGVSAGEEPGTYPPYDDGLKEGIFVTDPKEDKPFITKVWNKKYTVFPDFFNPKTQPYWERQIAKLHDEFAFDGLWIDMNDPSTEWSGGQQGCAPGPLDDPPYQPAVEGGHLYYRTVCMAVRHFNDTRHYDLHNVFASQESVLTTQALRTVRKKRPFVISRSSYPGQGHFTGVWTGDVQSSWDDMAHSISDVLSFSLFGIPLSGADICGFNGNTTVELCRRWSQLGAFYPFSRNHNSIENFDQDPVALGPAVVEAARSVLLVRYSLLPYLYTLFWQAHTTGDTVARPMFVEFPKDNNTYAIHTQFLWGPGLLIAPLLSEEKTYATAYVPKGRWYDFYSSRPIDSKATTYLLPTETDTVPLLLRGGHILPTQQPSTTTAASRRNSFVLLVSLCCMGNASGELYWDDGDSLDYENGIFNYVTFKTTGGNLTSAVQQWKYITTLKLTEVKVFGVDKTVTKVLVNNNPAHFTYSADVKLLNVSGLSVDLSQRFTLTWS